MPGLPSCNVLDARRLHALLPCSGASYLWGTPRAQNSPGCRGLSQTGLWWVLFLLYNTRSWEQSKLRRLSQTGLWWILSKHQEKLKTVKDTEGCPKLNSGEFFFLQHQKLKTVQDTEGCPKLVCCESFPYNTRSCRTVQDTEGCPKLVCGESFLTTPGAQNSP